MCGDGALSVGTGVGVIIERPIKVADLPTLFESSLHCTAQGAHRCLLTICSRKDVVLYIFLPPTWAHSAGHRSWYCA